MLCFWSLCGVLLLELGSVLQLVTQTEKDLVYLFWMFCNKTFPECSVTELGRTCSFICIRTKQSVCVERIDMSWHLDCSVCEGSRHSQEPAEEGFNARYRQETRTGNTWISVNHSPFSHRENVTDQSLSPARYRSVSLMILHYFVMYLLCSHHLVWPALCLCS